MKVRINVETYNGYNLTMIRYDGYNDFEVLVRTFFIGFLVLIVCAQLFTDLTLRPENIFSLDF